MSRVAPILSLAFVVACSPTPTPRGAVETHAEAPRPELAPVGTKLSPDARFTAVFADPQRRAKLEASFGGIDGIVTAEMKDESIPSVVVGVVVDGELAYAKGFGFADVESGRPADADTVYGVGSISKPVAATVVLRLRDEGMLSLDDALTKWVPEAAEMGKPSADSPPVTLRHILSHTSGLPREGVYGASDVSDQDVVRSLGVARPDRAPGVTSGYSNLGYGALGVAAGRAAGTSFRQAVRDRVFRPLGMGASTFVATEVPAERLAIPYERTGPGKVRRAAAVHQADAAGGLFMSVRDLARFAALHLSAYPPRSDSDDGPVRRSTLRESHEPHARGIPLQVWLRHDPAPGKRRAWGQMADYGYGWFIKQTCTFDNLVMHGGKLGGYITHLALLPEHGVAVVMLTNSAHANAEWLSEEVLGHLHKSGGLAKRVLDPRMAERFTPSLQALQSLIGKWDEGVYRAMQGAGRPAVASEEAEFAGYRATNGACTSFTVGEITSPSTGNFIFSCERGTLDMSVTLGLDGRVHGFSGISRGIAAPPAQADAASRIAALITSWDARVYQRHFSKHAPDRAKAESTLAALGRTRGRCSVKGFEKEPDASRFLLACEHFGDMHLTLELDDKDPSLVKSYRLGETMRGACPTL